MIKYIIIFLIFSFLGWLYEYTLFNRDKPDGVTKKLTGISIPILPIYGIGGVMLLFIYDYLKNYTLFTKIIVAAISINIMECLSGLMSYEFYGYQTWKYNDNMIPTCYGYISLITMIWWVFLIVVIYKIMDNI